MGFRDTYLSIKTKENSTEVTPFKNSGTCWGRGTTRVSVVLALVLDGVLDTQMTYDKSGCYTF